ncbi:MAG: hypothetical protein ACO3G4_06120 [Opitutaceae bacterium]
MKPSLLALVTLAATVSGPARGAGLPATTAVHVEPSPQSAVATYLKAGEQPRPAPAATAPAGWMAIELPGPFEVYVENKDLTKSLDVRPGAALRQAPKADAPVLVTAGAAEKATITGIRGRWTQLSLERPLVGFIQTTTAPAPTATRPEMPAAATAPAPVNPGVYGTATAGQPVAMVNLGDGGSSSLPRQYAGRFVSTRRPLAPRRPYDYALLDDSGQRFAYLDVSRLLQTEQVEKYVDLPVNVYGTARPGPDGREIILTVETLQLR